MKTNALRSLWTLIFLTLTATTSQSMALAQPDCKNTAPLEPQRAVELAIKCVGWIDKPDDDDRRIKPMVLDRSTRRFKASAGAGLDEIVDELLSIIAKIAVDRAKRAGLAMVHEQLTELTCNLEIPLPEPRATETIKTFRLSRTCHLIQTTDLESLVGQGTALRAALTNDLMDQASELVAARLKEIPPFQSAAIAGISLIGRLAADPSARLTKTDVWLVAAAALNARWDSFSTPPKLKPLKYALASARVYLKAQEWSNQPIDLSYVIKLTINQTDRPKLCDNSAECTVAADIVGSFNQWTNLAITMAAAAKPHEKGEDIRAELRAAVQLIFQVIALVEDKSSVWPAWLQVVVLAALDADAPNLISVIAKTAAGKIGCSTVTDTATDNDAKKKCAKRQKLAMLLTGISTYAITYVKPPENADAAQLAVLQQQQRDARVKALESVIEAATDRRGRAHDRLVSLGVGVGFSYNPKMTSLTNAVSKGQLHLPMGVAYQLLPGSKRDSKRIGFGLHAMATVLDLGNYIRATSGPDTKVDWRAIVAPGVQVGAAIGRSHNFFVLGGGVTYLPQFLTVTTPAGAQSRSTTKWGFFAQYYFSLWDFN